MRTFALISLENTFFSFKCIPYCTIQSDKKIVKSIWLETICAVFMERIFTDMDRCRNTRWKWRLKKYCQLILINDKTETISYFPLHNIRAMKSKYISLAFQFPVKMILFVYIVGIRLAWNCSHWELQWCFPCTKMAKQKNETETLWLNGRASFSISL